MLRKEDEKQFSGMTSTEIKHIKNQLLIPIHQGHQKEADIKKRIALDKKKIIKGTIILFYSSLGQTPVFQKDLPESARYAIITINITYFRRFQGDSAYG